MQRVVVLAALALSFAITGPSSHATARAERARPAADKPAGLCSLKGKVQVVSSFGTYKIQVVSSFPDLKVKRVTSFPDNPGEWMLVDSFPDFTVQVVDSFPDFTVQYVDSFPGCS